MSEPEPLCPEETAMLRGLEPFANPRETIMLAWDDMGLEGRIALGKRIENI